MSLLAGIASFDRKKLAPTETVERTTLSVLQRAGAGTEPVNKPQRVLILSKNYMAFHHWLSSGATKVLLTSSATRGKWGFEAEHSYTEMEYFDNYDTSGLLELRAMQLHAKHNFTHVVALVEEDMIRAARLREAMNISYGQRLSSAWAFRDKVEMKTVLRRQGVRVPQFAAIESAVSIVQFVAEHGYPVVVKPRRGHSSIGTVILRDEEGLTNYLSKSAAALIPDGSADMEVEEFITGTMYHVDGLKLDGSIKVIWPSRYLNACADFRTNTGLCSIALSPDHPLRTRLQEFADNVVTNLSADLPSLSFHLEAWHTAKDEIILCEVASRTGGAEVRAQIFEGFGVDLNTTYAQVQCENPISNPTLSAADTPSWNARTRVVDYCTGWIVVYPREGVLERLPSECSHPSVLLYRPFASAGERFGGTTHCVDAVAHFLYKCGKDSEAEKTVDDILAWFNGACVWSPAA